VLVFFEERERGILREKRGDLVAVCAEKDGREIQGVVALV
jgi:hypothetical protein